MIGRLKGILLEKQPPEILLDVQGVGYELLLPMTSFYDLPEIGQETTLFTHLVVREDAHLLFGFHTEDEKEVFLKLISVSGIGPTTALAIVAVDDNQGLVAAVDNSDIKYLMKFPKIGKKTAQQMVLDLAGKFAELPTETTKTTPSQPEGNHQLDEAMEALLALGYKAAELKKIKVFFEGTNETAEQYIKSALKMLMK